MNLTNRQYHHMRLGILPIVFELL